MGTGSEMLQIRSWGLAQDWVQSDLVLHPIGILGLGLGKSG